MATMSKAQLNSELNKWKKDELIDFIVNKKLPNSVKTNSALSAALNVDGQELPDESEEDGECTNQICQRLRMENINLVTSIKLMEKLQLQMEKRTEEQEMLIGVLSKGNVDKNSYKPVNSKSEVNKNKIKDISKKSETIIDVDTDGSHRERSRSKSTSYAETTQVSRTMQPVAEKKGDVKRRDGNTGRDPVAMKKGHGNVIKGKAKIVNEECFKGACKKAWFYIGRASNESTCDNLNNYLKSLFTNEEFEVEELRKHDSNTSKNKSFKLGCNYSLIDRINQPDIWPENIIVRPYRFFRYPKPSTGKF